jgi:protein-disulfide isomerase
MSPARTAGVRGSWVLSCVVALGCGAPRAVSQAPAHSAAPAAIAVAAPVAEVPADPPPIPVTSVDPTWGKHDAPVTIVWFDDMQCPFCAMAAATVAELRSRYGPDKIRIVHKNFPLLFHPEALPAAEAAAVVHDVGGTEAYWKFLDLVFANQKSMAHDQYLRWADEVGVPAYQIDLKIRQDGPKSKVSADVDLGKSIGVVGTPCFFVNGVKLTGAQPLDEFTKEIDRQLSVADELVRRGVPRAIVHVEMTKAQFGQGADRETDREDVREDTSTVHRVPVAGSPARGPAGAMVTIVEFTDFECPFCRRVQATIDELRRRYGNKIRIVFKHNPLPFHQRAEPAARFTVEARKQKGDAGFWLAHDALWGPSSGGLQDADLERIGTVIGLDVAKVRRALAEKSHAETIAADQVLAEQLKATGTPTFFINGRRLVGAQPVESFTVLIDDEIKKVEQMFSATKRKAPSVYDEIQKNAKAPSP